MITNPTNADTDFFRFFNPRVAVTAGQLSVMRALAIAYLCGHSCVELSQLVDVFDLNPKDVVAARYYENEDFVGLDLFHDMDGNEVDALVLEEAGERYLKALGMWPELIDAAELLKPHVLTPSD